MRGPLKLLGQRPGGLALPRGRGFAPGAANPRCQDLAQRKARKAASVLLRVAEQEALVLKYHPGGLPQFATGGRTQPLSERDLQILKMRSSSAAPPRVAELAAELGCSPTTIRKALKRLEGPQTPLDAAEKRRRKGGRRRSLTQEENATLRTAFKKDPTGGLAEAAVKVFEQHGKRASRWTIARELRRTYQPGDKVVRKRGTERYAPLTDQVLNMQEAHARAMEAYFALAGFTNVFWQDESPFIPGCASRQGYGAERIYLFEKNGRHGSGEKVSLWGLMGENGWVKLWVTVQNGTDETCRFARVLL